MGFGGGLEWGVVERSKEGADVGEGSGRLGKVGCAAEVGSAEFRSLVAKKAVVEKVEGLGLTVPE